MKIEPAIFTILEKSQNLMVVTLQLMELPSHPEFIWQQKKVHHSYTVSNYCQDLSLLLWTLQPDMIFCVDYDTHADHRMLSLCFEKEMGKILQTPGNNYHPQVFKGFAYSTAYETVRDFYAPFLSSTQRPEEKPCPPH